MTAPLRLESNDEIATITLARPEQLNALGFEMLDALVEALDAVARSDARVLVLAAQGPAFCAGADRAEMIERKPAEWEPIVDHYLDPVRRIADLDIPVIAVDVPSGLDAQTGMLVKFAIDADVTVTFSCPKKGMVINMGPHQCGSVLVADIGVPRDLIENIPPDILTDQ